MEWHRKFHEKHKYALFSPQFSTIKTLLASLVVVALFLHISVSTESPKVSIVLFGRLRQYRTSLNMKRSLDTAATSSAAKKSTATPSYWLMKSEIDVLSVYDLQSKPNMTDEWDGK